MMNGSMRIHNNYGSIHDDDGTKNGENEKVVELVTIEESSNHNETENSTINTPTPPRTQRHHHQPCRHRVIRTTTLYFFVGSIFVLVTIPSLRGSSTPTTAKKLILLEGLLTQSSLPTETNHTNVLPSSTITATKMEDTKEDSSSSMTYPHRPFGTRNGRNVSLPVLGFPSVALARLSNPDHADQTIANEAVRHAYEDLGIKYYDVAPEYGDGIAQERLGPALKPYRSEVFLAAKTMYRDAKGSWDDLQNTLKALETDHLNLYQFHSISTQQDVDDILKSGGAMETFQKAKAEGIIDAIGFSAHSESMAIRMIETGLVDTCMFPINFVAYNYAGIGQQVLDAAITHNVGVIALKAGARGRLTNVTGDALQVPDHFHHVPEWKRQEMINFPVRTSKNHPTCWYEPEDDPIELNRLILWSLNQPGVTAVLPSGDLQLLDGIANMLRGHTKVPPFNEKDKQHMMDRYQNIVPIFHNRDESGTKVST